MPLDPAHEQKLSLVFRFAIEDPVENWTPVSASENEYGFLTSEFTHKASGENIIVAQMSDTLFSAESARLKANISLPDNWRDWLPKR